MLVDYLMKLFCLLCLYWITISLQYMYERPILKEFPLIVLEW